MSSVDLDEICLIEAERSHPVDVTVRVVAPARVRGDVSALTRVIRNLVDNAAEHARSAVRVEVDESGSDAVVRVIDDGPGVPPELAERIFERFFRADESRARTGGSDRSGGGGAGLGLAIARQVAERHGGSLTVVESPPGGATAGGATAGGATFELRLPTHRD